MQTYGLQGETRGFTHFSFLFHLHLMQEAALEIAMIKMVVPSMALHVIDRAIQASVTEDIL